MPPAGIPDSYMHINVPNSVCISGPHRQKRPMDPNPQSNRKSTIMIFTDILTLFHASYFNKLLLRNTTDFTSSQFHPQTLKMKSYQKLLPPSYLVGVVVWSIFDFDILIKHQVSISSTYNLPSVSNCSNRDFATRNIHHTSPHAIIQWY